MDETDQNENLNMNNKGSSKEENDSWPQLHSFVKHSLDPSFDRHVTRHNGEDIPLYRSSHHTNRAFDIMNEMQKINMLSDVTLVTDDGLEISAHKMILSACSPYFYAMFGNFGKKGENRIVLNGINHAILKLLISFIYSTQIHITECNVQSLLAAANLLQLTVVVNACSDFLLRQLHPSNCLGIRAFANQYDCLELVAQVDGYIEHYFSDIIQYEEFLSLSTQALVKLISNDRLAVPSEEIVFDSLISWINHNREKREECLALLIEQVRLPLMSQKYLLERVWEEKMIKASSQSKDYLIEALKYHLLKEAGASLLETSRIKPRVPHELPKLLVVVGGSLPKAAKSVECFDFRLNKWYPLADLPTEFAHGGIVLLGNKIYTVGGCTLNQKPLTKMNVYDPATDQWSAGAEMRTKRTSLGVATLDNAIYAIAGTNLNVIHSSCEAFDPKAEKWNAITPLPITWTGFAVALLNDLLYVAGGFSHHDQDPFLNDVICYDYETGEWDPVKSLINPRHNAGAGVLNGILYVVGGQNDTGILNIVEAFDPRTKEWQQLKDMPEGREHVAVVGYGKHLYVIGGNDGERHFTSVNVYCPESDTWEVLSNSMTIERGSTAAVIINKPHNYI